MQNDYTESALRAQKLAKQAARACGHSYVGSEHLLLGLLRETQGTASVVLREHQVDEKKLASLIEQLIAPSLPEKGKGEENWTPRAARILRNSVEQAYMFDSREAGTEHILIAILVDVECVAARLLHTMGINIQKMYMNILDIMGVTEDKYKELARNARAGESGQSSTPMLDQYSRDLTEAAILGKLDPTVGREQEIERIIQILSRRTKNNPCLIGEAGVGKTAIVEGLAQRIADDAVPDPMLGRRVVTLDMAGMVAGSKYRGEFEERIKRVIREVTDSGNILLFLDELHTIIGAGGAEGAIDASNILKPALARGEVQLIGATTVDEYRKYIEKDPALERRFQPVHVEEPTLEETKTILEGLRPAYEKHHRVTITDAAIDAAVKLSARYINDRFLPDKAIDLMDEACAKLQLGSYRLPESIRVLEEQYHQVMEEREEAIRSGNFEQAQEYNQKKDSLEKQLEQHKARNRKRSAEGRLEVGVEDIEAVVSVWTKIPVQKLAEQEGKRLLKLDKLLHKRVIGQEEAVQAVARAIRRSRSGLKSPNRPIGSFLFLGPTGVGKTELSKALADTVFGSEQSMIRVDMSEYMEKHSVSKLVGSPPGYVGYEEGGQLSEKVRRNPYSVILFDEIEKAHPDVFNILLQVLDEGHITDGHGKKVDFKNTILIMTSNAGAQSIITPKHLGFGAGRDEKQNYETMKSSVMEEVRRIFKPEFLNRIDDIIVFHALTKEQIREIAGLLLSELQARCKEQMNITLKLSPAVKTQIAEAGFDDKYGARPLRRAIQSQVEDMLAEEILAGRAKAGSTVQVSVHKGKFTFTAVEAE